jgi:hypothetical protein
MVVTMAWDQHEREPIAGGIMGDKNENERKEEKGK